MSQSLNHPEIKNTPTRKLVSPLKESTSRIQQCQLPTPSPTPSINAVQVSGDIDTTLPLRNAAAEGEEEVEFDPVASASEVSHEIQVESSRKVESSRNKHGKTPRRQMYQEIVDQGERGKFDTCLAAINKAIPQTHGIHRSALPAEPKTWQKLQSHPHKEGFIAAADLEFNALEQKNTWRKVRMRRETKALPLKRVFSYKFDSQGYLTPYKARLCVCGNYRDTNDREARAVTLATRTFHFLMAMTASFDLEAGQVDFSNAYLNANLDEEVVTRLPEGYRKPGWSLLLLRALYGLKRSGLLWQNTLRAKLLSMGYTQVADEPCLFQGEFSIVFFYVDDLVLLAKGQFMKHLKSQKQHLLNTYEGKDLGNPHWFLNIQVIRARTEKKITLLQSSYIDKMVQRYHVPPERRVSTPLSQAGGGPAPSQEKAKPKFIHFHQSIANSLIYIAILTQPEVAFAVNVLASQMSNPNDEHLAEAKRILLYLEGTRAHGLTFGDTHNSKNIHAAADAAFTDDKATMKSTEGYVFKLFGRGIDWRSKRQTTIMKSTTEAELLSLSRATSV